MKYIRSYLIAGLVVWLPILVTFGVLHFIVELMDKTIALLPADYQPARWFGVNIPGFGVIFSLAIFFLTGIIASNFLGQRLMMLSESVLEKIPLVRTIYSSSKQVIKAVFSSSGKSFRKAYLIEYPRKGIWTVAFQTGVANFIEGEAEEEEMLSLFVPTTPNPTSGFLMVLPKSEVREVAMSVDCALKYVISLGVMQPKIMKNIEK